MKHINFRPGIMQTYMEGSPRPTINTDRRDEYCHAPCPMKTDLPTCTRQSVANMMAANKTAGRRDVSVPIWGLEPTNFSAVLQWHLVHFACSMHSTFGAL